jgi:hypothetical protein
MRPSKLWGWRSSRTEFRWSFRQTLLTAADCAPSAPAFVRERVYWSSSRAALSTPRRGTVANVEVQPSSLPGPSDPPLVFRGRSSKWINIVVGSLFALYALGEFAHSGGNVAVIAGLAAFYAVFAWAWVRQARRLGVRAHSWGISATNFWKERRIAWPEIDRFEVASVGCTLVRMDGRRVQLLSLPPSVWGVGKRDAQRIVDTLNGLARLGRAAPTSALQASSAVRSSRA